MQLYPAIDLKDGHCVRLHKGSMEQATLYNTDPGAQAKEFEALGFTYLHVVDLNGAFAGASRNGEAVKSILSSINIPVQLGGGIRDLAGIERWLDAGVTRVILGTVAKKNPELVIEACNLFPGKIVVGIDAKDGMVATDGWAEVSEITAIDLAQRFEDVGVVEIIYTDINRDGTMTGPNIEDTCALATMLTIPVIASGGIAQLDDLKAIAAQAEFGISGAVVGKAIYEGSIDAKEALAL